MNQAQIEATIRTLERDRDEARIEIQRLKSAVTHLAANPSDEMTPAELAERSSEIRNILQGE